MIKLQKLQKLQKLTVCVLLGLVTSWVVSCSTGNVNTSTKPTDSGVANIEFWTMQLQPQFTNYFQILNPKIPASK